MKRKTWLAALLALCLLALPAFTALADETGMESLGEISAEVVDEIIPEPMDEITAEAVDQDIDAVTMDLGDADEQGDADRQGNSDDQGDVDDQSALLPEFTAVDAPAADPAHEATSDGNADAAGDTPVADDTPAAVESGAGDAPAPDDAPAESDAEAAPLSDDAPVSGEPAAPAEPLSASLEPETEQFSAAAMLSGDGIIGTITDDCISAIEPVTYNGNPQTPEVVVTVNGNRLTLNTDYTVEYMDNINAGEATVTVTGTGSYIGTQSKAFTINPASLKVLTVTGFSETMTFTGAPIEQNIVLKIGDTVINNASYNNYQVKYDNNRDVGTATMTIIPWEGESEEGHKYMNFIDRRAKTFTITAASKDDVVVEGVTDKTYTGAAQTQDNLVVKLNGNTLRAGTDYTVSYLANTDAGQAKVIIHGSANLGNENIEKTFTIHPASLTGAMVTCSPASYNYDGTQKTPEVTVKLNEKTLSSSTDYTVTYNPEARTDAGTVTVTVTGKGNYTDSKTTTFIINRASISNATLSSIAAQTYTGNELKPGVTVTLDGKTLDSKNYSVRYENNVNAGTATVIVTGTGNYEGSVSATFTINKADRTVTASYTGEVPDKVYDKTRNLPMIFTFKSSDFKFSNTASGDTVTLNPDATDSNGKKIFAAGYDGVNVGAHKVNITLAIKYTSANYNYKLANSSITSDKSGNITPKQLTIRPGEEINGTLVPQTKIYGTSDPSSYKARVAGVLDGDKLADAISGMLSREPGEDVGVYDITIGTIQTKGNYATDPNLEEGYFEITAKPITDSDIGIGSIPNQSYTASPIEPAITMRYGTRNLVQGTDFDVTFSNNVLPGIATATITGKGNYTGTRTASFRIVQSASMFNVKLQTSGTHQYTGAAIEPEVIVTFKREENGNTVEETLVRDTDYDVVYENNVEPGIATITVSGKGDYSFTRAISFAISRVSLISADVHISLNTIEPYTGSAIEPNPTVTFYKSENGSVTQKTLVRGTDYYIIYDNNIKPGPATITVVGKGYYEGARTVVFNIVDDASSSGSPKVEGPDEGIPIVASAGAASAPAPAPAAAAPAAQNVIPATSNTRASVSAAPGSVYRLDLGGQAGTKFKSSNRKVATVDQNGNVTFKKPGKVKITFKVGKKKRTVTLKVTDPTVPASVALAPVNTAVKKGDVVTLTPSVPGNANPGGYKWKSSNKKVATVKNGVVTFKKPGRVTITCTAKRGKKKARVKFRVSK